MGALGFNILIALIADITANCVGLKPLSHSGRLLLPNSRCIRAESGKLFHYTERQTMREILARIGSGVAAMGALIWILWPENWSDVFEGEPLLAFSTALTVWIVTEIKGYRKNRPPIDLEAARVIIGYHDSQFKEMLRDHDFGAGIRPRFLSEAAVFSRQITEGHFFFSDPVLQPKLIEFNQRLAKFVSYLSMHSAPHRFGVLVLQSILSPNEKGGKIPEQRYQEIKTTNELATEAWSEFDILYHSLRQTIPEAFSLSRETIWRYTEEDLYNE